MLTNRGWEFGFCDKDGGWDGSDLHLLILDADIEEVALMPLSSAVDDILVDLAEPNNGFEDYAQVVAKGLEEAAAKIRKAAIASLQRESERTK
jgi:hypothetical protein